MKLIYLTRMLAITTLTVIVSFPLIALAQNARSIMEKVDAGSRAHNNSAFSVIQISTCKFGIADGKVKCSRKPTVKKLESASVSIGPEGKDSKSIAIILEPASERGIGMLSYIYDSSKKDNETWLYLSALGKVKRIVASNSSGDSEPVSIFGSEFTTEDQETGKLDDYTFKLLETVKFQGRNAYVIEQTPTIERTRKTRYGRSVVWVDTDRNVVLKAKMYNKREAEIRRIISSGVEKVNGVWMARSTTILNLVTNRLSNLSIRAIHFGMQIDPELLSKRSLTDTAFRERQLNILRLQAQ